MTNDEEIHRPEVVSGVRKDFESGWRWEVRIEAWKLGDVRMEITMMGEPPLQPAHRR
jgi:hypothetical protein